MTSSRKWASRPPGAASLQSRADPAPRRLHGLRDKRHRRLSRRCIPNAGSEAEDMRDRARMNQWISAVNSYYLSLHDLPRHPRADGLSELGIPSDEKVVAHALPKIEVGPASHGAELAHGKTTAGLRLTLADFYLLPSTYSFSLTRRKGNVPKYPAFCRWRERMEGLPTVKKLRASLPPRAPIEHAREWAVSHRPKY